MTDIGRANSATQTPETRSTGSRKTLGVIGGLGPLATAHLLEMMVSMTDATTDQEHMEVVVVSTPSTPDRTAYLLDQTKDDPVPSMVASGQKLTALGVHHIAIPCVTSHAFYERLRTAINVPILNMVRDTARHLKEAGVSVVGIAATDGTLKAGLFQTELEALGIKSIIPTAASQGLVMSLIYDDVKAGRVPTLAKFEAVSEELRHKGAETVVLGCTELSQVKRYTSRDLLCLDAMEVLAAESILACGYPLRPEYQNLLSG